MPKPSEKYIICNQFSKFLILHLIRSTMIDFIYGRLIIPFFLIYFRLAMKLISSTILLTAFLSHTLPEDSVLHDRKIEASDESVSVKRVLKGDEVSLRCQVNTTTCGQYHNVKGLFKIRKGRES